MRSSNTASTQHYHQWLFRVQRVARAFHNGLITAADLRCYQRYILETGEFNAGFTVDELNYLCYPKSPFNVRNRHTYIRGTDTWATEILRQLYLKENKSALHDQPVFIDSDEFWSNIPKDTGMVKSTDLLSAKSLHDTRKILSDHREHDVWVCVDEAHTKVQAAKEIRKLVVEQTVNTLVPLCLQAAFLRSEQHYTEDEIRELHHFLKIEVEDAKKVSLEKHIAYKQPLQAKQERNLAWYGMAYGKIRDHHKTFLADNQIKNHKELKQFAQDKEKSELFEAVYQSLPVVAAKPVDNVNYNDAYSAVIKQWIKEQTKNRLKKFYYYHVPKEKFMGLDLFVLLGHKEAETNDAFGLKSLINGLGYRAEPARTVCALLDKYPLLFVDQTQTREFWDMLVESPMVAKLPEEKNAIQSLFDPMFNDVPLHKPLSFQAALSRINSHDCKGVFGFYSEFIQKYLSEFTKTHNVGSAAYEILAPEIAQSIEDFLEAYIQGCEPDLQAGIRAVQTIAEIMRVDLSIKPIEDQHLITNVIKHQLLKDFSVQQVDMTPYGMRAYLRVVQASNLVTEGKRKAKIFVTNQNYFEWIMHLQHIKAGDADVQHIRQLEDIDRSADYIFAEIHPNNATEKSLFSQNLEIFLDRMVRENWTDKKRTIVFDATLNALDSREIHRVLIAAKPLVDAGKLNLIVMQSLTKFSQLGLDERAGGLSIVINDGQSWQQHNERYRELAKSEPIDEYTLQFFSYFFNNGRQYHAAPSLTIQYMSMINARVILLYQEILERLRSSGFENQKYFQLTTSTDGYTCYLSFNTAGLLTAFDHGFKLRSSDIEEFSTSLLEEFLVPLCRNANLPLTRRMSIAFPLSSVNVALDSIRFTVGLESLEGLKAYGKIIAYIAHAINFVIKINSNLFEKDKKGRCEERSRIFSILSRGNHLPTLQAMAGSRRIPQKHLFGPYTHAGYNIYILHEGNEIVCLVPGLQKFEHREIAILEANIATQCAALSAEHLDYFFRGAGLQKQATVNTKLLESIGINGEIHAHYIPLQSDRMVFHFTKEGIALERDYNCVDKRGMVITKRVFSDKLTVIDMKYWQEKDVAISRFITFAIAHYVRKKFGSEFKVRGDKITNQSMYQQFLFKMKFENIDLCFSQAVDAVLKEKSALLAALAEYVKLPQITRPDVKHVNSLSDEKLDTSIFDGASQHDHPELVAVIIKVLGLDAPSPEKRRSFITKGFFTSSKSSSSGGEAKCEVLKPNP